jgi:hypothetical protein
MARPVGKFEMYVPDKLNPPVVSSRPISEQLYIVSHSWSDKTTWWQQSAKSTQEVLERDGTDGRIYHSDNTDWIDVTHGKIYLEDWIAAYGNRSQDFSDYHIVVTVDDVEKTEATIDSDAWPDSDGDYVVDYDIGDIKFDVDPGASAVIKATYYSVDTTKDASLQSRFTILPPSGCLIRIEKAEAQFSNGISMNDTLVSSAYAPLGPGYSMIEIPNSRTAYKGFMDYLNEAQGNYPIVPANFVTGARGISVDMIQIPWNWLGVKVLKASQGAEVRMRLENGNVFTNGICSCTFYCTIEEE